VEVDEAADSGAASGEFGRQAVDGLVLGRVARGLAAVGLSARVGSRAAFWGLGVPFEDPVAVAVGSETGCVES
jgi:hypothetical protein